MARNEVLKVFGTSLGHQRISICACFIVIFCRTCGTKRLIERELGSAAFRSPQCREAHAIFALQGFRALFCCSGGGDR